ncbi:MAG TPA: hypothetical protein H9679_09000 [Firmicutes bacterium]|nr:hypothetical protein [Bacillota bacterium]
MEELKKFPCWYWKQGLHDAKVLAIFEHQLEPDWKSPLPVYNAMEIQLDSSGALYETGITRIRLLNYKWISEPINVVDYPELWWEQDTLSCLPSGKFSLEIVLQAPKKHRVVLQMEFTAAEVEKTV